jgi:hypothetical protein
MVTRIIQIENARGLPTVGKNQKSKIVLENRGISSMEENGGRTRRVDLASAFGGPLHIWRGPPENRTV